MSTQPRSHSADERADLDFYFDPVCPFAWMTSKWVRMVAEQRDYTVDWRFISLRMINAHIDYDAHFPAGYEDGHTAGLKLLRVAARARIDYGPEAVGPLYLAMGRRIFDSAPDGGPNSPTDQGSRGFLEPILRDAGLPVELAERPRRYDVGRGAARGDRRSADVDRQGCRDADPAFPPTHRRGLLRPGDQPPSSTGGGSSALGQRDRVGHLSRFRRAQAQPARAAAACELRRRPRGYGHRGGLARR